MYNCFDERSWSWWCRICWRFRFSVKNSIKLPVLRYLGVCNVLHIWECSAIPTYRVYRLYDNEVAIISKCLIARHLFVQHILIMLYVCQSCFGVQLYPLVCAVHIDGHPLPCTSQGINKRSSRVLEGTMMAKKYTARVHQPTLRACERGSQCQRTVTVASKTTKSTDYD